MKVSPRSHLRALSTLRPEIWQSLWRCSASHSSLSFLPLDHPPLTFSALILRSFEWDTKALKSCHCNLNSLTHTSGPRVGGAGDNSLGKGLLFYQICTSYDDTPSVWIMLISLTQVDIRAISVETEFLSLDKKCWVSISEEAIPSQLPVMIVL